MVYGPLGYRPSVVSRPGHFRLRHASTWLLRKAATRHESGPKTTVELENREETRRKSLELHCNSTVFDVF